ncbi:hypothetical protein RCL1_002217 [Eukaryota sp. TZLM3-RCL]
MFKPNYTFGLDSYKRSNVHFLDRSCTNIVYASGNSWHIRNLTTNDIRSFPCTNNGGIGAIAVSNSLQHIAIAECGSNPNILIYSYPSLELTHTLSKGSLQSYTALAFSHEDTHLASVGGSPDYMLTVWDWNSSSVLLRSKAFSQDVYTVMFSPTDHKILITSGTVHIKFWTMASTFTGLKLDGKLGRFGAVELSDIVSFVQFPDGKVLSGSESGAMFLWEGTLIKAIFSTPNGPCHLGSIDSLAFMDNGEGKVIVSTGSDGRILTWDYDLINHAFPEDTLDVVIEPLSELIIEGSKLHSLQFSRDGFIVSDSTGACYSIIFDGLIPTDYKLLFSYFQGSIVGSAFSESFLLSYSEGGQVLLFDTHEEPPLLITSNNFHGGGSCLLKIPEGLSTGFPLFVAGSANGILRLLSIRFEIGELNCTLLSATRPHSTAIIDMIVSPIVTASELSLFSISSNGIAWFSGIDLSNSQFVPHYFINLKEILGENFNPNCKSGCVKIDGKVMIMISTKSNLIATFDWILIDKNDSYDMTNHFSPKISYLTVDIPSSWMLSPPAQRDVIAQKSKMIADRNSEIAKIRQTVVEEGGTEEEAEILVSKLPELELPSLGKPKTNHFIMTSFSVYYDKVPFICISGSGDLTGQIVIFKLNFGSNNSLELTHYKSIYAPNCTLLNNIHATSSHVIAGGNDGSTHFWSILESYDSICSIGKSFSKIYSQYLHSQSAHNQKRSNHVTLSSDLSMIVSSGSDGALIFCSTSNVNIPTSSAPSHHFSGSFASLTSLIGVADVEEDAPTIEEARIAEGQSIRQSISRQRQSAMRAKINQLKTEFNNLLKKNQSRPDDCQLDRSEFYVDDHLLQSVRQSIDDQKETVKKELEEDLSISRDRLRHISNLFDRKLSNFELSVFSVEQVENKPISSVSTIELSHDYDLSVLRFLDKSIMTSLDFDADQSKPPSEIDSPTTITTVDQKSDNDFPQSKLISEQSHHRRLSSTVSSTSSPVAVSEQNTLERLNQRRERKQKRQLVWDKFLSQKPVSDDVSSTTSAEANLIRQKQADMGVFVPKESPGFSTDNQNLNAQSKICELAITLNSFLILEKKFNKKVYNLRDAKLELIEKIKTRRSKLHELLSKLSKITSTYQSYHVSVPLFRPEERPELLWSVKDEILAKYSRKLAKKQAGGNVSSGFSGFQKGNEEEEDEDLLSIMIEEINQRLSTPFDQNPLTGEDQSNVVIARKSAVGDCPSQVLFHRNRQCRLIINQIESLIAVDQKSRQNFDSLLNQLVGERTQLINLLSQLQLRITNLNQEYSLMKNFETQESELNSKISVKLKEKATITEDVVKFESILTEKRQTQSIINRKLTDLFSDFERITEPLSDSIKEALNKIYKRKVKRKEVDNDDSDDDDFDLDDDLDFDSMNVDPDACPTNCPSEIHLKVLELREERSKYVEELEKVSASVDQNKVFLSQAQSKERAITTFLTGLYNEIVELQKVKQSKVNQIKTSVILPQSRIAPTIDPKKLPISPENIILAPINLPEKLKDQVFKHEKDGAQLKSEYLQIHGERKQLQLNYQSKQSELMEAHKKLESVQLLMFGSLVNLDDLEKYSKHTAELTKVSLSLAETQQEFDEKLAELQLILESKELEFTNELQKNTDKLKELSALCAQRRELLSILNQRNTKLTRKAPVSAAKGGRGDYKAEKEKLVHELSMMEVEMKSIQGEIELLRRKDTFVYNPVL